MVHPIDSILNEALVLSQQDRAALVRRLIESLSPDEALDDETEQAWALEVARRVEQMDRGEMKMVPGDKVRREVRGIIDGQLDG